MAQYHIWTVGCQMNKADSDRLGSALEDLGYEFTNDAEQADMVILNSCVVRQGAEDKVAARLNSLQGWKRNNPNNTLTLMGCMVGPKTDELKKQFAHVDFFLRPQEFMPLVEFASERQGVPCSTDLELLPPTQPQVSAYVPVIHGCDDFCTYCIVPYRRGRERSRSIQDLVQESEMLSQRGVKEITLLGQIVDRYGHDLEEDTDLADLLKAINSVENIHRVRFLTSHPRDMSQRIIDAVAQLEKACEWINLPFQSGDNAILNAMRRPYRIEDYLSLVERIREAIPDVALSTDVIVGFCGETEEQFENTITVLEKVRFDTVFVAAYSTRAGTIADRKFQDDIPVKEKLRRKKIIEELQERIATEKNAALLGQRVEILVEKKQKEKWMGRTRTNKLVFFDDSRDWTGKLVEVDVTHTGPWSLQANLPDTTSISDTIDDIIKYSHFKDQTHQSKNEIPLKTII